MIARPHPGFQGSPESYYLNGTKWCSLGRKPDLRWLYVLGLFAFLLCGGGALAQAIPNGCSAGIPCGGGNGASPGQAIPGYVNFNSSLLPFTQRCLAKVSAGTGNCIFFELGDSQTWGQGAGTGGSQITNAYYLSYPTQLAEQLGASGYPVSPSCILGSTWGGGTDNRLTLNSWANTASGQFNTLGGTAWYNNSDTTSLGFKPNDPVDTFIIYYNTQASGGGTFTINFDGGSNIHPTNTQTGTQGIATLTVGGVADSITPGSHTLNIQRNGTGTLVSIIGWRAYNSTRSSIHVCNAGWVGARTSSWADNTEGAGSPLSGISFLGADLMIAELGTNDILNSIANATSLANMQLIVGAQTQPTTTNTATNTGIGGTVINFTVVPSTVSYGQIVYDSTSATALGTVTATTAGSVTVSAASNWTTGDTFIFYGPGDTIVVVPTPLQLSVASQAVQTAYYNNVMLPLVGTTIPLVNLPYFFGSWNQNNAQAMQWDSYHPNGLGYGKMSKAILPPITAAGGL